MVIFTLFKTKIIFLAIIGTLILTPVLDASPAALLTQLSGVIQPTADRIMNTHLDPAPTHESLVQEIFEGTTEFPVAVIPNIIHSFKEKAEAAEAVRELMVKEGARVVLAGGGKEGLSLEGFFPIESKEVHRKIADFFRSSLRISGLEYAVMKSQANFYLFSTEKDSTKVTTDNSFLFVAGSTKPSRVAKFLIKKKVTFFIVSTRTDSKEEVFSEKSVPFEATRNAAKFVAKSAYRAVTFLVF